MDIHVVQPGETINSIGRQYGVSVASIIQNNQLRNPAQLLIGQALLILQPDDRPGMVYEREIEVGGYAYSFINPEVLLQTLPYLTTLLNFSYGFTPTGELIPMEDEMLLAFAAEYGVQSALVLTPFTAAGTFNNQLVNLVVENLDIQQTLIANLLTVMREKGYAGIDVDFEFILAEDRDRYTGFVRNLHETMSANGFFVSVALPPKTSADQRGLLYEGVDYGGIGAVADSVLLMTYEWGYTYGPPMAVAPLPNVRRVLEYAITEIPVEKIDMGIPNYGYDWPLPYMQGITKATTIGNEQAIQIATENGAVIQFDEQAQAPYFRYVRDGVEHEVWFEDVRSIQAKLALVNEYSFRGVGYWNLMRPFFVNWLLLNHSFYIL